MQIKPQPSGQIFQTLGAAIAFGVSTLFMSTPTLAEVPEQARVDDLLGNSSELLIRRSGRRESIQTGTVLQRVRDALLTGPPNNARAMLRFCQRAVLTSICIYKPILILRPRFTTFPVRCRAVII